jgi:hypothetical protein
VLGTAKADLKTDLGTAKEAEIERRDVVGVQPDPHLDEIFAEQGYGGLFDVHD